MERDGSQSGKLPRSSTKEARGSEQSAGDTQRHGEPTGAETQEEKEQPNIVEWVVGISCSLVVLFAIGYLFYQALAGPSLPPIVTIQAERILPAGDGYLVEFTAVNQGNETAANLSIEGSLLQDTVAVEKSMATMDFVPAQTERRGGLFFSKDPSRYRLQIRPTGYDQP